MRLLAILVVLGACPGNRPPPPLFERPPPDVAPAPIQIDLAALDAGSFEFELDKRSFRPQLAPERLPTGGTLVRGTFGNKGTVALARVGSTVSGVVREGKVGFEIVPFAGGHRLVRRSWAAPLRPLHDPRWKQIPAGKAPALASTAPVTIDILFAYTPAVLESRPLDGIKGLAALAIADLNEACAKGCPGVRFRSAGVTPTADTELAPDGTKHDMYALYYDLVTATRFKDAHAARETAYADILVLLVDSVHGALGLAQVMPAHDKAVAVVDYHDSLWYLTIPHEIGHIMGGRHDDDEEMVEPFPYGHAYSVVGNDRTILSNPCAKPALCPLVKRWSAPPLGDTTTRDNARVIRRTAKYVSTFRTRP